MNRKCDKCENEATIHEVTIHSGQKVEKHLCEQCAAEEGMGTETHAPVSKLLSNFVIQTTGGPASMTKVVKCPTCGMSFAEFRQKGLLGCGDCYRAFEQQLTPLIERAQEGASRHVGKVPKNVGDAQVRQTRLAELRRQLAEALEQERYEKAASIRDEIYEVDPNGSHNPLGPYEIGDEN
jgi:protein arginine kinase activator